MDSNVATTSRSIAGEKRKRETEPDAVEKSSKSGTSLTRKETEVHHLIDSLGELIEKNVKSSAGSIDKKEISMYKKKNAELESKMMILKAEIYDAKEALMLCKLQKDEGRSNTASPDQLLAQIEDLKKRVKSQKAQLAAASQTEKKLQDEIEMLREHHTVGIEAIKSANNAGAEELGKVKQELLNAVTKATEQQNMHSLQLQKLQTENDNLQEALQKKTAEHEFLSNAFKVTKDMNEAIMQKSLPLQAEKAQLQTQLASLTSQLEAAQVEHMSQVNILTAETIHLKSALALVKEEKATLEKEKNEIELQFRRLKDGPVLPSGMPGSANGVAQHGAIPTIPVGLSFSTHTLTANSIDDVSVLSDTTNLTDRRAVAKSFNAVTSPSRRVVLTTSTDTNPVTADVNTGLAITTSFTKATSNNKPSSNAATRETTSVNAIKTSQAYCAVLITTSKHIEIPALHAEAAKFGNILDAKVLPSKSGYKVEYDNADDASLAVYKLHNRVIEGATLTCKPFFPPPPYTEITSLGEETEVTTSEGQKTKPFQPQRCVFILHNAPPQYRMSEQDLFNEVKRYGAVVRFAPVANSRAFEAEFRLPDDAKYAVENFLPSMHGYRMYCKFNPNQLPKQCPSAPRVEERTRSDDKQCPVVLRDPVLSEKRPARVAEDSRPHCQICLDAKRMALVKTHTTERCRFVRDTQKVSLRHNGSDNSSRSDTRGRSDSRERVQDPRTRPSERNSQGSSSSGTSRSSDQRSATDSEQGEQGEQGDNDVNLIINGQVRPLSSKR